jgi:quercetin dioxygenase-like cupin family protein
MGKKMLLNIKHVPKAWGYEKWIVNKPEYCGKLLKLNTGKYTSWHFHKLKDEVMFLYHGSIKILSSDVDEVEEAEEAFLLPGEAFHIPRGLRHRIIALEDSELFEFSTQHFDSDSYRLLAGSTGV